MRAYTFFAKVYDEFMKDIPYVDWADRIEEYMDNSGKGKCDILELGCGTGRFSRILAADGYSVTGLDLSENMINMAKKNKFDIPVQYYVGDMRNFELNKKYDVVVSVCDSVNYLLNEDELESTFLSVKKHLKSNGLFIFDLKTESYYEKLGDNIFSDEIEKVQYFWENDYDKETRNNNYYISFFVKKGWLYRKIVEEHIQHAFIHDEIENAALRAGLRIRDIMYIDMKKEADFNKDRVYYILEVFEK